ncbi:restriction endonuclease [Lederbergia lenta]|uniref:Type II restriction endonuclease family protein n=1 Tax=Lederbergia lenta TaxID=1467 RepID=A0A2X4ZBT7_LEDLE|nr:restriction endonuclease [Lederbergia lenta]MEC2322886.1 restriction endonuclease [Lederbergia lenta]SQI61955.1 type II restriction endonuclease family protein [Lederbergia lenta]
MTGKQFEEYLYHLLSKKGYKVRLTKTTGDFGADLLLTSPTGKCIVVQVKRYKKNVGIKAVQEVGTAMPHYQASEAWVVTNSYYTKAACTLAKSNDVHLYNREDLINWIVKVKKTKVS